MEKKQNNKGIPARLNSTNRSGGIPRPPVVAVMGHIDHGKSTLLDYIRKSNLVEKETGGITQHISAYEVVHKDENGADKKITFLDTPGHEAFKAMRSRGAVVADIAILVVSAEDGVKPQTIEAFSAINEAKIPYIVAINKIDKPEANLEKTIQTLLEAGIYIEGYGGEAPHIPISAKTGVGIPQLLNMIVLIAELESFEANGEDMASGVVIESSMDNKKGIAATLIIKNGAIKKGQFVATGKSFAPVRIMENFLGENIDEATFSSPIRIIGWNILPKAGDEFEVYENKSEAEKSTEGTLESKKSFGVSDFSAPNGATVIPVVIKADVLGSVEAVMDEIKKIETDFVKIKIVEASAGQINENDVKLLSGTNDGLIIGFSVKADSRALELAERNGLIIKTFDIIYKLTEWLSVIIKERTPKTEIEEIHGSLKVLKTFSQNKDKQVVGGKVESGKIVVGDIIKIIRRENEIGRGKVKGIQVQKQKNREVLEGSECGLEIESKMTIERNDNLQSFMLEVK